MKRRDEVAVGILITIAVAVLILGVLWLARGGLSSGYPLHTRFAWGQNLKPGQPVLLGGVTIGFVHEVELRDDGYLDVLLRIDDERKVPKPSHAQVQPVGIFGDVSVGLIPQRMPPAAHYAAGDTVPPGPPMTSIGEVMSKADSVASTVNRLTLAMERQLVQAGALRDIQRAVAAAAAFTVQLQGIAAEQNRNMTATLAAYREAVGVLDSARIGRTLANLEATTANTTRLTASLDSNSVRLNGILARLERGEGTAGKLLTDTLLYRDIRNLVSRTDSLMADFQRNPRKYINLEIF